MKRNQMPILVFAIAIVLTLGIFLSFYWSFIIGSGGGAQITLPSAGGDTEVPENGSKAAVQKAEITVDTVQQVVASMSRPESCSFSSEAVLYSSEGSTSWSNRHYVKNGYTKTEQYNAHGSLIKHIITGNGMIFIWRPGGDARYYSGHLGDTTSDNVQMIPTYEDIINRKPSEILEARYDTYSGNNCIYVKAEDTDFSYIDEYWISLDYGLLVKAVTTSDDAVIYEMEISGVSTAEVSDDLFLLPNKKLAMDVTVS